MAGEDKKGAAMIWGLGLLFLAGGLALLGFGVKFVSQAGEAKGWPQTQGEISKVAVRSSRSSTSSSTRTHYTELTYTYQVDGKSYESSRYRLGDGSSAGDAEVAKQWSSGDAVEVSYDPANPASAVLKTDRSWGVYVPVILGLFFGSVGALLVFVMLRGKPT